MGDNSITSHFTPSRDTEIIDQFQCKIHCKCASPGQTLKSHSESAADLTDNLARHMFMRSMVQWSVDLTFALKVVGLNPPVVIFSFVSCHVRGHLGAKNINFMYHLTLQRISSTKSSAMFIMYISYGNDHSIWNPIVFLHVFLIYSQEHPVTSLITSSGIRVHSVITSYDHKRQTVPGLLVINIFTR